MTVVGRAGILRLAWLYVLKSICCPGTEMV
jgi:hypothetical protein